MTTAQTLTAAQAAATLGVTRATVIAWARAGTLVGHQHPNGRREWRFSLSSVERHLADAGHGARRGRPPGAAMVELESLRRRVETLEASAATVTKTSKVVAGLVALLEMDGTSQLARSEQVTLATERLASILSATGDGEQVGEGAGRST